jgi:CHAT domain-containing protein
LLETTTSLHGTERRINLLVGRDRIRLKALQLSLADSEVIVEYVLTEPHSYCLAISRERITLIPLASRKQIEELSDRFIAAIRGPGPAGVRTQSAKAAYDVLLRPVSESQSAKRLLIVPDGKLHLLPFDTLLTSNAIESRIVSMVPSASVFYLLRTRPQPPAARRALLAVGGVPYARMFGGKPTNGAIRSDEPRGVFDATYPAQLPNLPGAEAEVVTAAKLLGPSSVVFTGDQATESAVKAQNLTQFGILHFAVHAFADPKYPGRAALVLASDSMGRDDGLLQPREIGRFELNAGVVVLSACDTAVGPTLGQEGVLNIARAFLLAGSRAVITTLWTVSDVTSATLMRRFYENLAVGYDVAESLMRGKASVLEQFGPDALSTVAAFQIIGVGDYQAMPKTPTQQRSETRSIP